MKVKKFVLLVSIILFAATIRLFKIDSLPPSLYYDEVDAGYQAQIFNQNHTDYYGNKFPIHFHSFGDFRTSLHIYSIALVQKFTNNQDLSVRLPSAIYGTLAVVVIYLITSSNIAAFLLAISPWAIHYSRIGFESSGMILCLLFGIYFWQKFTQKSNLKYLYLSIILFALSPYFYSTAKLFIIITALIVLTIWWPKIKSLGIKKLLLPVIFGLLILSPMLFDTVIGKSGFRFSYISIFTLPHREQTVDTMRYTDAFVDHPNQVGIATTPTSFVLHNKYQLIIKRFISNYVNSFSGDFLLLKGDQNPRHGFGDHGLIYLLDPILIIIGIYFFFTKDKNNKISTLFLYLLIFAPIPYALTRDTDSAHSTRLIIMLPSMIYFSSLGISTIIKQYKYSLILFALFYSISFISFWHYYNYHYPQDSARYWNAGMKEATIATKEFDNQPLVYSDSYLSFVSYFLYYQPYSLPKNDSIANHLTQIQNKSFSGQVLDDKYYFGRVTWSDISQFPKNTIYIVPKSEYSSILIPTKNILKTISKKYINQEEFYLLTF